MMLNFQLSGLAQAQFQPYFDQSDEELERLNIRRVIATSNVGFPCRISLQDAAAGDELLLLPYCHHPVGSPYRALGPIYVRKGAMQTVLPPGVVPEYVTRRVISIRGYDGDGMMISADVQEGPEVCHTLSKLFENEQVSYVHLHNAKPGCFSCTAVRA
jgi:hypothetical protein